MATEPKVVELEPPDMARCQAFPNVARHSFMTLGPRPTPVRCEAPPVWLAVEIVAGRDGWHGPMTVCQPCCELMMESSELRRCVQLQPINKS